MRASTRSVVAGFVAGILGLGAATAGTILAPEPPRPDAPVRASTPTLPAQVASVLQAPPAAPSGERLPSGRFLVGTDRTSLAPDPAAFGGTEWRTDGCFEIEQANPDLDHALPADGHGWAFASRDCIYLGGFGIGPARAARGVDDGGVWVRSVAISNGERTVVYQIVDSVGYFSRYQGDICSDCGFYDIRTKVAADTGLDMDDVLIASTHSHSGPDNYGGWGGVPDWYWRQLRDSIHASALNAIDAMAEGTIDVGEVVLRSFNNERRDHYYSTPDYQAVWLQARDLSGATIATLANYAGHPTIVNTPRPMTPTWDEDTASCTFVAGPETPVLHADWPGAAARSFERTYGGVGLLFEGGLGNVSVSGHRLPEPACDATADDPVGDNVWSGDDLNAEGTGQAFASSIAADITRDATRLDDNTIAVDVQDVTHPVMTNAGLAALSMAGAFSREFLPGTPGADGPGTYSWQKGDEMRPCTSASPTQIRTFAGAHRIGEFGIAFGPGELFSNITEVVKSKARNNVALAVFGQANDALGYIMQSFEYDYPGLGAAGEYATNHGEYEEVFAIDHCFGDHVTQSMLDAAGAVGLR